MAVTLTSPVEGKDVGESYSGPREEWLVLHGYAARQTDTDGVNATDVDAKDDPTLPENREDPPEDGPDGWTREDGEAVLAFKKVESIENLGPEAVKPAGLEHPTRHGTTDLNSVEEDEDKLSKKIHKGVDKVLERATEDDRLAVVPQADPTPAEVKQVETADPESEKVVKRSAKAREKAETDIPESSVNVK